MEATTLMTTGDHLLGEVTIEDTDAAATRAANEWQGTAIWTAREWLRRLRSRTVPPRARRVDRSAGPHGQNQEVYDAELHAIYRAMLTLPQVEPRGQKITIFAEAALQRITFDAPGPGQRYTFALAQQAHDLWEQHV